MQEKNLNIIPSGDMPVIYASQYDKNRVIRFNLFEGEEEYTLAGTEIVKCNIRKNDEHIVVITPTIGANKYIDIYLPQQACACFGDNIGEITISRGEDNIIGTINFILKVERNPIQGGVTSETDIDDLTGQIEAIVQEVMTDDYYTKTEVDAKLDLKANAADVYTKAEVDTALSSKANASDVYTKSQVDTALGLKADKADTYTKTQVDTALALKADTTSVYTKSEVDTALALKANAADVYTKTEVDEMIDDLYPVNTASGAIANFTTSLAKPLTALTSTIVAQQAGTGTPSPSNPRSISGVSSVGFTQQDSESTTVDSFTITLGQTVYGGSVDCINGTAMITHGIVDLATYTGTVNKLGSGDSVYFRFDDVLPYPKQNGSILCDKFSKATITTGTTNVGVSIVKPSNLDHSTIAFRPENPDTYTTTTIMDYIINTLGGVQVVYELSTPIEITGLTPANFTTFAGEQNIFSDCGEVTVEFKQGIQEYIDDKTGG